MLSTAFRLVVPSTCTFNKFNPRVGVLHTGRERSATHDDEWRSETDNIALDSSARIGPYILSTWYSNKCEKEMGDSSSW